MKDRILGYFGGTLATCGVVLFIHAFMGSPENLAPVSYALATFLFLFGQWLLWS
jgi:hypothetical protein